MMKYLKYNMLIVSVLLFSCSEKVTTDTTVTSPDNNVEVAFKLNEKGMPTYEVSFKNDAIVKPSTLGFEIKDQPALSDNFEIVNVAISNFEEIWEMPWGEQKEVENKYNQLKIELQETSALKRKLNIVFKVYNDGIGFRYEFPEQENLSEVLIMDEKTQFNLTGNHKVWWAPGDWDIYEHLYNTSNFSEIDALSKANHPNLGQHTYIPENAVNTPVTMKTAEGLYLSFHEAGLIDYSDMTLKVDTENLTMTSNLVGSRNTDYKVKRTVPFNTPWRTMQIAEKAGDLIESKLIVNLNEPNKLGAISWFKPTKYTGIWWEMHLNKSTWDYGMTMVDGKWVDTGNAHGKHGATTENAKAYIDFSAKNNIGAVLIEGWNTGWENWIGFDDREGVFDFVTPYPDYDLEEVARYAKEKGVEIIMHHETSAATQTYEKQQDTAYALMQSLGIHAVKTGYVGAILPKGEYHHGQHMVNHYNNAVINAAKYQVAINAHEPIKATGLRRTYPNTISREGLRGQEFNAWASDGGNPPAHLPLVAFTRMLGGPVDYTPGIFDIKFDKWKKDNQVNTTIAQQLALYVVIYSPVQMAADLIENYEGNPALQFIKDVGVDWQQTKVLNAEVGEFVTIARKERTSENWFVGAITNEDAREMEISFDFLDENEIYSAIIYEDGENAHWNENPTSINIREIELTYQSKLKLKLAPGGGFAISIIKK